MPITLLEGSNTCSISNSGADNNTDGSGNVSFTVTCTPSNTYSFTAANSGTPALTESASIVVFELAFSSPPTSLLKGQAFSAQVSDISNGVNQNGVTLYLVLTGGTGSLVGTASYSTAGGAVTYPFLSISAAGSYTLKVSAKASGTPGVSTSINVYQLVFTQQPTNVFHT